MSDEAPPKVVHCYIREHIFTTPREAADNRTRFAMFAEREGFQLGKIYTEKPETVPAAFHAMVQALHEDNAAAVVIPSPRHFAVIGEPAAVKRELEQTTSAKVLVAGFGQ